jgi:hypothetical protein
MASLPTNVVRDSRGRFYATTPDQGGDLPFVYDADGTFLQQLGRVGEGPGEYRAPQALLITGGDTLHIFDKRLARVVVLSPSWEVVRTVNGVAAHYDVLPASNGGYVVNNGSPRGYPLRRIDTEGQIVLSYGADEPEYRLADGSWRNWRHLATSQSSGVWAASRFFRYTAELWDTLGTRQRRIIREPEWFPPSDSLWNPTPDVRPMPRVTGLWEDGELLWVLGTAADPEWANALGEPTGIEGRLVYPIEDYAGAYDGVIEVIDAEDGTLMASCRIDDLGQNMSVIEPGLIAMRRENEDGWWFVDALRAILTDPSIATDSTVPR